MNQEMTREELDKLWNIAMRESAAAGEPYTRYRFAALVADAEREKWIKALDAEMVSCHLGVFNSGDDPRAALAKLLAWHQDVALDPAVSSGAQNLILEEREACARICDAYGMPDGTSETARILAKVIRARGNK
jgi:hypothetical protein